MSNTYIQLKQGIKIGGQLRNEVVGDFELIDNSAIIQTALGIMAIPEHAFLARITLSDDIDITALGEDVYVIEAPVSP